MDYRAQYDHPKWQEKRLMVLSLHNFHCQECLSGEKTLHVHHPIYRKGAKVWEYDDAELMCLCEDCHRDHHLLDSLMTDSFSTLGFARKERIISLCKWHSFLQKLSSSPITSVAMKTLQQVDPLHIHEIIDVSPQFIRIVGRIQDMDSFKEVIIMEKESIDRGVKHAFGMLVDLTVHAGDDFSITGFAFNNITGFAFNEASHA